MNIDIKDVLELKARLREINKLPLKSIKWFYNGERILVSKQLRKDFDFLGLLNTDFIDALLATSPRLKMLRIRLENKIKKDIKQKYLDEYK